MSSSVAAIPAPGASNSAPAFKACARVQRLAAAARTRVDARPAVQQDFGFYATTSGSASSSTSSIVVA